MSRGEWLTSTMYTLSAGTPSYLGLEHEQRGSLLENLHIRQARIGRMLNGRQTCSSESVGTGLTTHVA